MSGGRRRPGCGGIPAGLPRPAHVPPGPGGRAGAAAVAGHHRPQPGPQRGPGHEPAPGAGRPGPFGRPRRRQGVARGPRPAPRRPGPPRPPAHRAPRAPTRRGGAPPRRRLALCRAGDGDGVPGGHRQVPRGPRRPAPAGPAFRGGHVNLTAPPLADEEDPLAAELAALAAVAPVGFDDAVFARWVEADGPVGPLYVAFTDRGISYVCPTSWVGDDGDRFEEHFRDRFGRPVRPAPRPPSGLGPALRSGRGTGLRYDLRSVGDVDRAVLAKTLEIPVGEVRPYAWIAREIGHPAAVRAAGSALGRNPVPILIPCHRVVRSDGATGNYGFGPALKIDLLRAERVNLDE